MPVATRLRDWLREERIPHKELAEKLGLTQSAVSSIINGRNQLSVASFIKILEMFPELCPRWILLGEDGLNHHRCGKFTEPVQVDLFKDEKIKMLEKLVDSQADLIQVLKKMHG